MFLKNSRYYKQKIVTTTVGKQEVKAVTLRRLPGIAGEALEVKGNDRLDILAQHQYEDPTLFWHIADANIELEANRLVEETGRIIEVPEL